MKDTLLIILSDLLSALLVGLVVFWNKTFACALVFISNEKFRLLLVEGKELLGFIAAILVFIKVVYDLRKSIKK